MLSAVSAVSAYTFWKKSVHPAHGSHLDPCNAQSQRQDQNKTQTSERRAKQSKAEQSAKRKNTQREFHRIPYLLIEALEEAYLFAGLSNWML